MTNAITYLSDVDYIIVMKNGVVVDSGSYNDLMAKQGTFADYIAEFSQEDKNAEFEVPLGNTIITLFYFLLVFKCVSLISLSTCH